MASKISHGFMFYLLLVLGIILGAFVICIMLMIFVPDFSLFGVKYFKANYSESRFIEMDVYANTESTDNIGTVNLDAEGYIINNIEINSNLYSIRVVKSSNNPIYGINYGQFVVIFNSNYSGFTTDESAKVEKSINYYQNTGTLSISITGPEGFIKFGNPGSITLQIPPDYNTNNINLNVKTNNDITIGDRASSANLSPSILNLRSINLEGNGINITNYSTVGLFGTENCSIKTGNGAMSINTTINAKDLTIVAGETTLDFNKEQQSFNLSGDLSLTTNNTIVYLGDVNVGLNNVLLNNTYGKIYVKGNIIGNVVVDQNSLKCDYEFKDITGRFFFGNYFDEKFVEGGNIKVDGIITGNVTIATTGKININRIQSLTKIKNTNGAVNIDIINASAPVNINTINGNINLGSETNRVSSRVNLTSTGSGLINIYFNSFIYSGETPSTINTRNGKINIYLIENMERNISATTTKSLKYLGVEIISKSGEWVVGDEAKLLNISSSSDIVISNK